LFSGVEQDERAPFEQALGGARVRAYAPGEYVEQENFMLASEILALARHAGIAAGVSVLDLCCGVAGPGRFITRELGCSYLGVDADPRAVEVARARAAGLDCRFAVARVPPLPDGRFDVVLLLETMLAFRDKAALLAAVAGALPAGGRFVFTLEEGTPLTVAEQTRMPDADTVWLTPLDELTALLEDAGLQVVLQEDHSASHRSMVDALVAAFETDRPAIAAAAGARPIERLLAGHQMWSDWLGSERVRKFAVVAEKPLA